MNEKVMEIKAQWVKIIYKRMDQTLLKQVSNLKGVGMDEKAVSISKRLFG